MEAQLSIDRLIKVMTTEMSAVMSDLGIASPGSVSADDGARQAWRGVVAVHFFNPPDRCFYWRVTGSPLRAAVSVGLIGEDALKDAYSDYARIVYRYIGSLQAALGHIREIRKTEGYIPCALNAAAHRRVEEDLEPLDALVHETHDESRQAEKPSDEASRISIRKIAIALSHNHVRALGIEPDVDPLPELILRYLPDPSFQNPVSALIGGQTSQHARGHRWFSEPEMGALDFRKRLSACTEPWQRLAALTEFFVVAPWLGVTPEDHRRVLSVFAEEGDDGWTEAVKRLPSLRGRLREIVCEVHSPLAPVARIVVYHNGAKKAALKECEHQLHDAVLVLGTQLAADLRNYVIRVAAERFSDSVRVSGNRVEAWRNALHYLIPYKHAEIEIAEDGVRGNIEGSVRDPYSGSLGHDHGDCETGLEGMIYPLVTVDGIVRYHPAYEPRPDHIEIGVATPEQRAYFSNAVAGFAERTSVLWNLARGNFAPAEPSYRPVKFNLGWCHSMLTRYLHVDTVWNHPRDLLTPFVCYRVLTEFVEEEWDGLNDLLALALGRDSANVGRPEIRLTTRQMAEYIRPFVEKAEPFGVQVSPQALEGAYGSKKRTSWESLGRQLSEGGLRIEIVPPDWMKEVVISWEM